MIKSLVSKINIPIFMCLGFSIRLMAVGASVGDAIAMAAMTGLYGGYLYLESKKEAPVNEQVKAELAELRQQMGGLSNSMQMNKLRKSI